MEGMEDFAMMEAIMEDSFRVMSGLYKRRLGMIVGTWQNGITIPLKKAAGL
jgi:hypothetical protein